MRPLVLVLLLAPALSLALVAALGPTALAQERPRRPGEARDVWSEPNPGVRYLHRTTTTPCEVHALVVDLRAPGVRLAATRYDDRWASVSDHARTRGVAAAINGGFWTKTARPMGLAIGGGAVWPTSAPDPEMGSFAVDTRGRARIHAPGDRSTPRRSRRSARP